ncbi:MAG: DegQ family serine endoprotease [Desulfomonilia bacterium]|nr:DegQ family serine endoprotease [Deltaproteobacteria bacterium]HPD20672.1 DegQ family serine endoprotease [Deltaproteobacteria bacterium]HPX17611.1 DegQ family serine endoprotease [Deltaproteobacteria bacterium]HRS55602.1 DegQ family serine endoprotease [Desulfomonilia bacterium]HRV35186.1 DegQ family serine endoprotease [Desulfomonilia bacterium]
MERNWIEEVAEQVLPSVVNISSVKKVTVNRSPLFSDPFFRDFFGDGIPRERVQQALGSGVIVSGDGYIVTSNHVVSGADEVEVRLSDERVFTAKIIGNDPKSDVAVIKIDAKDLPVIKIGKSSNLRIGSYVLALGNPYGLAGTVTHGIISALGRSGLGITEYENFIQTDAPINPGNSGGALVNMDGELIGINTAILSQTGGNIGIGFAIPVDLVMDIVESLRKYGRVVRGWLGVTVQEITPEIAEAMELKTPRGVLIADVIKGSPAAEAGIRQGDVVVSINGKEVNDPSALQFLVSEIAPGTKVPVTVIRNGSRKSVTVTIGDLSEAEVPRDTYLVEDNRFLEGARIAELSPPLRESLEVPNNVDGVVVAGVESNSPASSTGLRPGDVIVAINGRKIAGISEFKQLLQSVNGRRMEISIYRQGMILNMTLIR